MSLQHSWCHPAGPCAALSLPAPRRGAGTVPGGSRSHRHPQPQTRGSEGWGHPTSGAVSPRGTRRATACLWDTLGTPQPRVSPPKNCHSVGWGQAFPGGGSRAPGRVPQPPGGDKRGRGGWRWGTRMPSSWVLVLAVLGGACALPAPAPLAYTQALAQAVDSFNQRPEVQNVFRLLSADPEPNPDVQLSSLQRLNFTIMETRCSVRSGARPDSCEFKDDGVIKDCSAPVPVPQRGGHPALDITCVDSTVDPVRVKRFWPLLRVAIKTVATAVNIFKAIKGK
ncbi:cathelicidin-3-like [Phalacrocorax carbo]|uniref:cathelicidin-3-like n=1 Tax=Phalacrocorax carbo TaxID=9209 RepID=UPI0031192778